MKLTKRSVEELPLPKSGQRILWDDELKGFGVRLTSAARTYIVQARVNGVSRRISLGRHGVITPDEARKRAVNELSKMLAGKDPMEERARKKAYAKTLRELGDDYIRVHTDLKASSIADINKHIDRSFAAWRDRPVTEITRDKVAVKFRELSERSGAQSNQAFRVLRALMNYARAAYRPGNKAIIVENPVDILSQTKVWNRVAPKSARIPSNKIGVAWNLLQALRQDPTQTTIGRTEADIVCFLLLTGCRWSEAAELTWNRVDLDGRLWHLPDPKNRNPVTFPLSDVTAAILDARRQDSGYVFPSRIKSGHIRDARGIFKKISQAVGADVTAHDMRRTFRAVGGECGLELWKIKLLMNHRLTGDVTLHSYTETGDLQYLAPEINAIGVWITSKALEAASANVVPIKKPSKGKAK